MLKPQAIQPALPDRTIPLTRTQRKVYTSLAPHYEEQVGKHPGCKWLKTHYNFIVGALRTGVVGSNEGLVAGAIGSG